MWRVTLFVVPDVEHRVITGKVFGQSVEVLKRGVFETKGFENFLSQMLGISNACRALDNCG